MVLVRRAFRHRVQGGFIDRHASPLLLRVRIADPRPADQRRIDELTGGQRLVGLLPARITRSGVERLQDRVLDEIDRYDIPGPSLHWDVVVERLTVTTARLPRSLRQRIDELTGGRVRYERGQASPASTG